ncbi:hypothetical protein CRUP_022131, partial [Coryphaenoides rupestris]
ALRLSNGRGRCSGRLEIFHSNSWGTVCDDEWELKTADVVCRQLGCGQALSSPGNLEFGPGSGPIWLDNVVCNGEEEALSQCAHQEFGEHNCGHHEDVGVICRATIRLLNGSNHCSGRLEIFQGGHWAPVFNHNWGLNEALVVCKEMQCGEPMVTSTSPDFGQASQVTGYTAKCNGGESSISQCSLSGYAMTSRDHAAEATVVCSGQNSSGRLGGRETMPITFTISYIVPLCPNPTGNMRLANGSNRCTGRVEVYHNGQWGTVCDDSWDMLSAKVVCKNLQCGKAQKIPETGFFGRGNVKVLIEEVSCRGREHSLDQCQLTVGSRLAIAPQLLEFTAQASGYLVRQRLVHVRRRGGVYSPGMWEGALPFPSPPPPPPPPARYRCVTCRPREPGLSNTAADAVSIKRTSAKFRLLAQHHAESDSCKNHIGRRRIKDQKK